MKRSATTYMTTNMEKVAKALDMEKTDNELIAEFMGMEFINDDPKNFPKGYWRDEENSDWITVDDMRYNESWDWLMSVVEKIGGISIINQVSVSTLKTRIWFSVSSNISYIQSLEGDLMISKCYNTVVEFIKWYNEHGKA